MWHASHVDRGLVDSLFGHYQVPFRQPLPEHDDGAEGKAG